MNRKFEEFLERDVDFDCVGVYQEPKSKDKTFKFCIFDKKKCVAMFIGNGNVYLLEDVAELVNNENMIHCVTYKVNPDAIHHSAVDEKISHNLADIINCDYCTGPLCRSAKNALLPLKSRKSAKFSELMLYENLFECSQRREMKQTELEMNL